MQPVEDVEIWVKYLGQLGLTTSNTNLYDEQLIPNLRVLGTEPIRINNQQTSEVEKKIRQLADSGRSGVILITGTAGDGKTQTARKVWEKLRPEGDCMRDWILENYPEVLLKTDTGADYTVTFVKDLSSPPEGSTEGASEQLSVTGVPKQTCRVIACNHGKLMDQLREEQNDAAAVLADKLEGTFFSRKVSEEFDTVPDVSVILFDLSNGNSVANLEEILTDAYGRAVWASCQVCPCKNNCPILFNRNALWDEESRQLRTPAVRQLELVRLIGKAGVHIPIRDLLNLAANNILGRQDLTKPPRSTKLLSCKDVANAVAKGDDIGSYFTSNLIGENLPPHIRKQNVFYDAVKWFAIGEDAPRLFDALLTEQPNEKSPVDIGSDLKDKLWNLSDSLENEQRLKLLKMRRQVAFFLMADSKEMDRWLLSAFAFGRDYLALLQLQGNKAADSELIQGMNVAFTGQLLQDNANIYVATSGTSSDTLQGELLLVEMPASKKTRHGLTGAQVRQDDGGQLMLVFYESGEKLVEAALTPQLYNFFRTLNKGELPGNFSQNCLSQFHQLKSRLIRACSVETEQAGALQLQLLPMMALKAVQITVEAG